MEVIRAEVGRIVAGLDEQIRTVQNRMAVREGIKIPDIRLADFAFNQFIETAREGKSLAVAVNTILAMMAEKPIPKDYLTHVFKACAYCASATCYPPWNEVGAWQQISFAAKEAGAALAIFVSHFEQQHRNSETAKSGGNNRGKKNGAIKAFVLSEWATGKWSRPGTAATAISQRFLKPYGKPELNFADYGVGRDQLSEDRLDKTFAGWIREDEGKKLKKTLAQ